MTVLRTKNPSDRLDYDVDFSRWLLTYGDSIVSATAVVEGGTVMQDGVDWIPTSVKVWLAGGADGDTAHVTVDVTTAQGRTKEVCFRIRVKDC